MHHPGMSYELDRFVVAQDCIWEKVLAELRAARKECHWMWFVFPQIAGLGASPMAQRYAIGSLAEAEAYAAHPVLGARLRACTAAVNAVAGRSAHAIFGSPDDLKFRSSMTLFARAVPGEPVFADALARYFDGVPDPRTLAKLGAG